MKFHLQRGDYVRIYRLLLALLLFSGSLTYPAIAETDFIFQPQIRYNIGKTDYTLKFTDGTAFYKSKLEFPTDALLLGQTIGLAVYDSIGRTWQYKLTGFTNLNDRLGTMTDSDWIGGSPALMTLFSYTESGVKKKHLIWEAEVSRRVLVFTKASLELNFGYRYQRMATDIYGITGWQIDITDSNLTRYDLDYEGHFLYYRVTYNMPYVGGTYLARLSKAMSADLEAAAGPVFASDYDDHFSRNKFSTAEGTGFGSLASATVDVFPVREQRFKISFFGEFEYFYVPAKQRQEWYGDDPVTPDQDDTGRVISNINYEFRNWQLNFGLRLELVF